MCGIAGFNFRGVWSQRQKANMVIAGFDAITNRGPHAVGWANINIQTGAIDVFKRPGSWEDFKKHGGVTQIHQTQWNDLVMLHTRHATHGDPKENKNNHPHDSKDWLLFHNGVLRSRPIQGYPYNSDCDSEIAVSFIQTYGVDKALEKLGGSMALAFVPKAEPWRLHLYRDGNPIIVQEKKWRNGNTGTRWIMAYSSTGIPALEYEGRFFMFPIEADLKSNSLTILNLRTDRISRKVIGAVTSSKSGYYSGDEEEEEGADTKSAMSIQDRLDRISSSCSVQSRFGNSYLTQRTLTDKNKVVFGD